MLKIGDFSRLGQISVDTLRHYDAIGLLKPAEVDTSTGYRYYAYHQLGRLHRILALKDIGLSLEQIAAMLQDDVSAEQPLCQAIYMLPPLLDWTNRTTFIRLPLDTLYQQTASQLQLLF